MTKPKHPLFQKAIALLESLPNLQATIQGEPYLGDDVLADGELMIQTSGKSVHYICEIKTDITNEVVEQVAEYFTNLDKRLGGDRRSLLITRNLSKFVVDRLLERKIEFIDVDGNIYLDRSAIYLLVRKQPVKENHHPSLEITAASIQVIYILLKKSELLSTICPRWEQEENIANLAGVNSKTVINTLNKLQKLGYIKFRYGQFEIIDYVKLFERWEVGYSERLRSKLLIGTFDFIGDISFTEMESKIKSFADPSSYLIGGELAAAILTRYLHPIGATLHLNSDTNDKQLAVKLKLKPSPEGKIILLRKFGRNDICDDDFNGIDRNLVDPLLIHAELINSGNGRLKETAQVIYDKYIEEIAQKNDRF
jgi:hypothetical protein